MPTNEVLHSDQTTLCTLFRLFATGQHRRVGEQNTAWERGRKAFAAGICECAQLRIIAMAYRRDVIMMTLPARTSPDDIHAGMSS